LIAEAWPVAISIQLARGWWWKGDGDTARQAAGMHFDHIFLPPAAAGIGAW